MIPPEYEDLMNSALRTMEQLRDRQNELAELRGEGEAAKGLIRAEVSAGGKVASLDIDPRAMRLPAVDLSAEIMLAFEAATQDLVTKSAELMDVIFPGGGKGLGEMLGNPGAALGPRTTPEASINTIIEDVRRAR